MLGQRRAARTNRYVHLNDATLKETSQRVAKAIFQKLGSHVSL